MSDEYCEFVGPNSSPEEESAYLDPISMTSNNPVANNMQAEAETVYETPIPVPLTNSSKASERKSEKAIKSNLNQLRSTFHKSEAAGALSKAFKLPKKILSSDHFQFGKDANRRDSSISKQEESDIYVDVRIESEQNLKKNTIESTVLNFLAISKNNRNGLVTFLV